MPQISTPYMLSLSSMVSLKFNLFLQAAPSLYKTIAMEIPSAGRENVYPKLDEIPGLREWIGDRVVHQLSNNAYSIVNKTFEETLGIDRDDIEDDQFGIFQIAIDQLAKNAAELPDLLVYRALAAGATTKCYDGQYFFDTDHVNYDASGNPVAYANIAAPGSNPVAPWFLFDTRQPLKPMIYQPRRPFVVTTKVALNDDNVFHAKRFEWGVDGRCAAGYGLWQTAFMSTKPLTPENYQAARAAMGSLRRKDGAPLGITPDLLVTGPSLESAGRALCNSELISMLNSDGTTFTTVSNPWKGSATYQKSPWLS
ncbi:Mu-like prophage major head subunit gpT family protein [Acidisoma sp. 7E03]